MQASLRVSHLKVDENVINIPASIDIDEPLIFVRGVIRKNVEYRYNPGDPVADRVSIEWYLTEADAEAGVNRLPADLAESLIHWIQPERPYPLQGDEEELTGTCDFLVPLTWPYELFYGKILIWQMGIEQITVLSVKSQPVGPFESRRQRLHYPQWENK